MANILPSSLIGMEVKHAIYVMDTSGNNSRRLTNGANLIWITSPNWPPDGKHIAFVSWFIGKRAKGKASGIFTIRMGEKPTAINQRCK